MSTCLFWSSEGRGGGAGREKLEWPRGSCEGARPACSARGGSGVETNTDGTRGLFRPSSAQLAAISSTLYCEAIETPLSPCAGCTCLFMSSKLYCEAIETPLVSLRRSRCAVSSYNCELCASVAKEGCSYAEIAVDATELRNCVCSNGECGETHSC